MYSSAIAPSRHLATVTMRSPFSNSPMTLRLKERQGQGIGQSAPDRDPLSVVVGTFPVPGAVVDRARWSFDLRAPGTDASSQVATHEAVDPGGLPDRFWEQLAHHRLEVEYR